MAILNGHYAPCTFHIFINRQEKLFIVVCDFPSKTDISEPPEHLEELENLPYIGFHKVAVDLCAGEMIYPYFNGQPLPGEEFAMELTSLDDISDCIPQIIDVSFENAPHQLERPPLHSFELKRRVANSETVLLCAFDIPQAIGKLTTNPFHRRLTPKEIFTKFHGKLEKIVDVRYLMGTLKKQHIFSGDEAFYICQGNTREARMRCCLNLLMNKEDRIMKLFVQLLSDEYDSLAREMLKHFETECK
ncbi:hypothetical protein CAPTEDRAFT_199684 [Capitella teleta]|uniref:CARD domain-containing protein n=1 Tax=Capitella teleta TaxID=283909 RepID=R7VL33_CAPTE|nr:hypothetical protein CAPTEDRAFT_199684 [Capitella teleta]|eukprot:ELU17260.1 hypothetical protein CAPTEDRAFT_199684 [Capitella teleta]